MDTTKFALVPPAADNEQPSPLGNADLESLLHWLTEEERRAREAAEKAVARAEAAAGRRAQLLRAVGWRGGAQ
jgi:hypothetical protein